MAKFEVVSVCVKGEDILEEDVKIVPAINCRRGDYYATATITYLPTGIAVKDIRISNYYLIDEYEVKNTCLDYVCANCGEEVTFACDEYEGYDEDDDMLVFVDEEDELEEEELEFVDELNFLQKSGDESIRVSVSYNEEGAPYVEILRPMVLRLEEDDIPEWGFLGANWRKGDIVWTIEEIILQLPYGENPIDFSQEWCRDHDTNRDNIIPELKYEWYCWEDVCEILKSI